MRLSLLPGKERTLQTIRKSCGINFEFREVAPKDAQPEAIEELAAEIFRAPFDFVQGPLYRAADLRRAANDHVLVFAIHHAIADGWSLGVLVQDLFAAYIEIVMGSSEPLPPVPQTYTAWGATERAFWQPAVLEQRSSFGEPSWPVRLRMWNPPITPGPPKRWLSAIPANLTNETRELARQTSVTFFSVLFGAFQIAFSEWSGFDDLGSGNAGRQSHQANRTRNHGILRGYCTSSWADRSLAHCGRSFTSGTSDKRLTRLPTPSLLSNWPARSARNRKEDTIRFSKCVSLCRTIPCRKFRCRIFPHV